MIVIAIVLLCLACSLVFLARKEKAKDPKGPKWFLFQMAGSGIGLVSVILFYQLAA